MSRARLLGLEPVSAPLIIPTVGAMLFGIGQIGLGYTLWARYGMDEERVQTTLGRQVQW